jgi:CspA family cold shock protein
MPVGTLRRFNAVKKYGFIVCDSEAIPDVFVHVSELNRAGIRNPRVGAPLVYEIAERDGKTSAVNVEALKAWQIDNEFPE